MDDPVKQLVAQLEAVKAGPGVAMVWQEQLLAIDPKLAHTLQNTVQAVMGYVDLDQLDLFLSAEDALEALRHLPDRPTAARRILIKHVAKAIKENRRTKQQLRSSLHELSRLIHSRIRDIHPVEDKEVREIKAAS